MIRRKHNEIIRTISCPEALLIDDQPNEVRAHLEVDENGTVKILAVNATNEKLKDYVVSELTNLKVKRASPESFILVIKFIKA